MIAELTIRGAPRTKKTSNRVVRVRGRIRVLPSKPHQRWARSAILQLQHQWRRPPLRMPVRVAAVFHRDRAVGDLLNYEQALADALERARVVANDRLIASWDGSRLARDPKHPRIDLRIEEIPS